MKVAIISDVHDNLANLKKVLRYCAENKIQKMICCGDTASEETIDFLVDNFSGKIWLTPGNMDAGYWDYEKLAKKYQGTNLQIFPAEGEVEIDGHKVAFIHFPNKAKKLAQTGKYEFVFYGHTHKPWEEKINGCRVLNPGNVANIHYPATFAVWTTGNNKVQLLRVEEVG